MYVIIKIIELSLRVSQSKHCPKLQLRIRAIESMTKIGCSIPEQLPRVAYLLVQILPVNDVQDSRESEAVIKGLKSLLNTDPSGVLTAVFHQLKTGEPQNRSSVIAFLEEYFFKNKDQYLHSSKKAELVFVEQLLQVCTCMHNNLPLYSYRNLKI